MTLDEQAQKFFRELQREICSAVETSDGAARFGEEPWEHTGSERPGGGVTRVISEGAVFEKGGVNFSAVHGELTERLAARLDVPAQPFFASGLSLVLHPRNPWVPTSHMNVRFIQLKGETERAWFGGGADLTPYYLIEEDAAHFHASLKAACDRHDPAYYPRFKEWCDSYFWLPHRGEARGVGGIFFDYLTDDLPRVFDFVQDVGRAFVEAYLPVVDRRKGEPWTEDQRRWQLIRRGRYVEFNLIHDRGTLFGLETGGRTESILMSLPPVVRWTYDHRPQPGSPEESLLQVLRKPRDW